MSDDTPAPAPDRLAQLAELASGLMGEVEELTEASGNQFVSLAERSAVNLRLTQRVRRFARWLAVSVAVDIALSGALAYSLAQVSDNTHKVNELTQRLNISQTVTRQDTLCPLYTLLLAGDTAANRAKTPDKAAFDHSYTVITAGYKALDCTAVIAKN